MHSVVEQMGCDTVSLSCCFSAMHEGKEECAVSYMYMYIAAVMAGPGHIHVYTDWHSYTGTLNV